MNRQTLLLYMLVGYAFAIAIMAVASVPKVIGADWYYHIEIAKILSTGNILGAWNYNLQNIFFPYGFFAFQFMLAPTTYFDYMLISRILECFFMPTTYALVLYLVNKTEGTKPAAITGLILLGGWAFMDGTLQVRPESLDLLLYPITVYALMTYKKKTFITTAALTIYSHSLAAFSIIYGLALNKIRNKQWKKTILLTTIIIIPVIILSTLYIQGAFQKWGGAPPTENPQEYEFWTQPLTFIPIYCGSMLIGIPFLFKRHKTELETLLTWGFTGSLIMLPLWADRWLHYSSIPLAIFAANGIANMKGKKQLVMGIIVTMLFMLYYATWLKMSLTSEWWQPGD